MWSVLLSILAFTVAANLDNLGVCLAYGANGTRINGRLLQPEVCCALKHGDVLAFGSTLLLFRMG